MRDKKILTVAMGIFVIGVFVFSTMYVGFDFKLTGHAVFTEGPEVGQTILTLQDAGTDNLDDAYVDTDANHGGLALLKTGSIYKIYIKFNISLIPINQNIDNSLFCLYDTGTKKIQTINVSNVYSDWNESTITWSNQPCGADFDNSSACNLTAESFVQMDSTPNLWRCWNVTNMVGKDYSSGSDDVSMVLYTSDSDTNSFNSKEYTADTSLIPYLNITYSSADTNASQISFSSSTTEAGTYTQDNIFVGVDVTDDSPTYSFINFDNSLVGFWKMNDTETTIKDYSGYGNNGINNGTSSISGKFGNALNFDGNDAIEIQHSASISINTPYSISAWIKPSDVSGMSIITSKDEAVWEMMMMVSNGELYVGFENCADDNFLGQGGTITVDNWQHVVYVYNGSRVLGYIEGVEVVNVDGSGTPCVSGHSLGIGDSQHGISYPFSGTIDEVLIFNRVLSSGEISALHNASSYSNNFTNLEDGSYDFYSYVQDASGNENQTETRAVNLVSNVVPSISIENPKNQLYTSNESLALNFIASDSDGNLDSCWYNIDNGNNISLPSCENTIFNVSGDGAYTLTIYANDSEGLEASDSVNFNVDVTGVSVFISEPTGTKTSRTGIVITYTATGNNLNCWFNVKTSIGGVVIENITLENCTSSSFSVSNDGDYVLNLYVNNTLGSSDSNSSSFSIDTSEETVVVAPPSSDSGGGSGGGTIVLPRNKLEINPINLVANPGDTKKLTLNVKNVGTNFLNDCKIKTSEESSSWVSSNELKNLAAGEEYNFNFDLNVLSDVESGEYILDLFLECKELEMFVDFVVEVIEQKLLFELVKVERINDEEVMVVYLLKELSGVEQKVELQFLLLGNREEKTAEVKEINILPANSQIEFKILIPVDSSLKGDVNLLINLNSETYSTFFQESIILGSPISGFSIFGKDNGLDNFFSGFFILLFLVFAFFIVRRIVKHRKKSKK